MVNRTIRRAAYGLYRMVTANSSHDVSNNRYIEKYGKLSDLTRQLVVHQAYKRYGRRIAVVNGESYPSIDLLRGTMAAVQEVAQILQ